MFVFSAFALRLYVLADSLRARVSRTLAERDAASQKSSRSSRRPGEPQRRYERRHDAGAAPPRRQAACHGSLDHAPRTQLAYHLSPGDLVVANDAATIPASLRGFHEPSGSVIEIRLAGRASLSIDDVHDFSAIVFGAGDHRTRTEHRMPPPALRTGDALTLGPLKATVTNQLAHPRLVRLSFVGSPDEIWDAIARHGKPIQYAHIDRPLMMWDTWTRVAARPVAFEPPSASFVMLAAIENCTHVGVNPRGWTVGVGWIDQLRVSGCIHTLEFLRRPVAEGGVQASSIVYLSRKWGSRLARSSIVL